MTREGPSNVSRDEWRWAVLWALVILALTSLPYLIGWLNATPEIRFGGIIYDMGDSHSYLAKMLQGAEGAWLFHLPYTPEPHNGGPFYLFYLYLGKLTDALGLPIVAGYHLGRLGCGLFLLLTVYRAMTCLTPWRAIRRIAYLMASLGSGFGWLAMAAGMSGELGHMPLDLWSPDGFAFVTIYGFPHMCFSQAMLLQSFVWGFYGIQSSRWRDWIWASITTLFACLVHPYSVAFICGILGAYIALRGVRARRLPWHDALRVAFVALPSVPYVLWVLWAILTTPAFASWTQSLNLSPSPVWLVTGYGLAMPLAALGAGRAWKTQAGRFAISWAVVNVLATYIPSSFQRRLLSGFQVPLAMLAATGLVQVLIPWIRRVWPRHLHLGERYTRRGMTRLLIFIAITLMTLTNLIILGGGVLAVWLRKPGLYHSLDQLLAMDKLAEHAKPGDVVLTSLPEGNYLPTRTGLRVVWGLSTETVDFSTKQVRVQAFFSACTLDVERRALLHDYSVAYVLHGPNEKTMGDFDLRSAPYLAWIDTFGPYDIYLVTDP